MLTRALNRLLDRLFGTKCPRCPARIFPKDQHDRTIHAKDCS